MIADSPDDVQPVLDAIVESAKRLIGGFSATAFRVFDGMVHLAAFTATDEAGAAALRASFPAPLSSFYGFEPLRSGRVIQVEDTETDPQVTGEWRELARQRDYRANAQRADAARRRAHRHDQRHAHRAGAVCGASRRPARSPSPTRP